MPDAGDATKDCDARQAAAVSEGLKPDAGDRFACYNRRYD
jgi:hypothetical protein